MPENLISLKFHAKLFSASLGIFTNLIKGKMKLFQIINKIKNLFMDICIALNITKITITVGIISL